MNFHKEWVVRRNGDIVGIHNTHGAAKAQVEELKRIDFRHSTRTVNTYSIEEWLVDETGKRVK